MFSYDENVSFWKRTERKIQSDYICRPQALGLLGDIRGKRILDIGCGDGYVSRMLAIQGAEVTAVDLSGGLIQAAIKQEEFDNLGIEYKIESALKLDSIENESFDASISILVFGHFNNEEMYQAIKETWRILKPGGTFILAVPHPVMYLLKPKTKWVTFKGKFRHYWEQDDFIFLHTVNTKFPIEVKKNTVAGYLNGLIGCGFRIQEISEPRACEDDRNDNPEMWGDEDKIPFYLIINATKEK